MIHSLIIIHVFSLFVRFCYVCVCLVWQVQYTSATYLSTVMHIQFVQYNFLFGYVLLIVLANIFSRIDYYCAEFQT